MQNTNARMQQVCQSNSRIHPGMNSRHVTSFGGDASWSRWRCLGKKAANGSLRNTCAARGHVPKAMGQGGRPAFDRLPTVALARKPPRHPLGHARLRYLQLLEEPLRSVACAPNYGGILCFVKASRPQRISASPPLAMCRSCNRSTPAALERHTCAPAAPPEAASSLRSSLSLEHTPAPKRAWLPWRGSCASTRASALCGVLLNGLLRPSERFWRHAPQEARRHFRTVSALQESRTTSRADLQCRTKCG